jgi:acyl-CoA reductase-like NAD-dependent aldehyde dehydrogenase
MISAARTEALTVARGSHAEPAFEAAPLMAGVRAAQARWARVPLSSRLSIAREIRRLMAENASGLARASAFARSRPPVEALTSEVLPLIEACRFLEREAKALIAPRRMGRRGLPIWLRGVRSEIHREPLGVVLIIGPGNYPLFLPGVQLLQALIAGNGVLLKPGIGATAAATVLLSLICRAGIDPELVALLPESSDAARAAIAANPDKVLFTGSAATGEKIRADLAPRTTPSIMELSGCDAVIVRADADIELVVKALVFGLELNGGATCISPKRVFVARDVAPELEAKLADALRSFPENGIVIGSPLAGRMRTVLGDAVAGGARMIAGEIRENGTIAGPVVMAGVSQEAQLLREDFFAPVASLVSVVDDREALLCANDSAYGLAASIFTQDEAAARSLAAGIDAGTVTINDIIVPTADPRLPFGGRKLSGNGFTRGAEGLLELTVPKVVTLSRGKFRPAFFPSHPGDEAVFLSYLQLAHQRGLASRLGAILNFIKSIHRRIRTKN